MNLMIAHDLMDGGERCQRPCSLGGAGVLSLVQCITVDAVKVTDPGTVA